MSERDIHLLLYDMNTAVLRILEYTAGMDYDKYELDYKQKMP